MHNITTYIGIPELLANLTSSGNRDSSPLDIPRQCNRITSILPWEREFTRLVLRSHPRTNRQNLIRRDHRILTREESARQRNIIAPRIRAINQVSQIKDELLRLLEEAQSPGHVFDVCPFNAGLGWLGGGGAPELDVAEGDGAEAVELTAGGGYGQVPGYAVETAGRGVVEAWGS